MRALLPFIQRLCLWSVRVAHSGLGVHYLSPFRTQHFRPSFPWRYGGVRPSSILIKSECGSRVLHRPCVISPLSVSVAWGGMPLPQRGSILSHAVALTSDYINGLPYRPPFLPIEMGYYGGFETSLGVRSGFTVIQIATKWIFYWLHTKSN